MSLFASSMDKVYGLTEEQKTHFHGYFSNVFHIWSHFFASVKTILLISFCFSEVLFFHKFTFSFTYFCKRGSGDKELYSIFEGHGGVETMVTNIEQEFRHYVRKIHSVLLAYAASHKIDSIFDHLLFLKK